MVASAASARTLATVTDPSDRIEFRDVIAAGQHLFCSLDGYYFTTITVYADGHCMIAGPRFEHMEAPNVEEAKELVRMWLRRRGGELPR